MKSEKKECTNSLDIQMNVCSDYGSCGQCHWFDGDYYISGENITHRYGTLCINIKS